MRYFFSFSLFLICLVLVSFSGSNSLNPNEKTPIDTNQDLVKRPIWIDADIAVGMKRYTRPGYSDVDDGYAVLQLMKSDKVEIIGISTVFGNTRIDDAFRIGKYMIDEFAGGKIPVYKGAGEAINLQSVQTNEAVEALAAALRKQKMRIMAVGPATNVGLLLLLYPELSSQIEEVVLVAGRRKHTDYFAIGTQGNRAKDLNFDLDNDAFRLMFENKVPVTLCPFEISNKVWVKGEDLDALAKADKGSQWLAENSRPWLAQWISQGADGFNPFDVLASHYMISPEDIISEPLNARLEIHIDDTIKENNKETFKQYLICDKGEGYPVKYCYNVVPDYHEKLINSFIK
ncbi:nucleoside hydrolase [Algoriphagus pacificus]|uniref:Nucleoside hydrolase n=1 Tax=Algoriphagus pacificus TaxID=2811234 RepID=A0ABS3CHD0_9BACT|nr:nucleoside hydrolase [Algoriphagus pacificus]MBN7816502.1 nucleoside hydrolase [Algoriphagus pacificus]